MSTAGRPVLCHIWGDHWLPTYVANACNTTVALLSYLHTRDGLCTPSDQQGVGPSTHPGIRCTTPSRCPAEPPAGSSVTQTKCLCPHVQALADVAVSDLFALLPSCVVHMYRYCCQVASWFCGGIMHMCDQCHRRPSSHYQCPGPGRCVLRVPHPPPGIEFCLGCAVCRTKEHPM